MIKNLRQLREESRISQQRLAEMLNTSQQSIFKYEKTTSEPDIATLIKLADIFDVSVDYLIGKTDDPSPKQKKPAAISDELWEAMQNNPRALALLELLLKMSPEQMDAIEKVIGREEK